MEIDLKFNELPSLDSFFEDNKRYYVLYGGRGSGKSWGVAQHLVEKALAGPERILCCREIQNSLSQSVKRLLVDTIRRVGAEKLFVVKQSSIHCPMTGAEFMFSGLWNHVESIKSMEGITIVWVEEAQTISHNSMKELIPTIRTKGSYFIFTMNPRFTDDWVYENFILPDVVRPSAKLVKVNWSHNPWFEDTELVEEKDWLQKTNYPLYLHVWEGEINNDDEALVFKGNVRMEEFETPVDAEFVFGQDYGFSVDPMAFIRSFMKPDDEKTIYIDYESGGMTRLALFDHPEEMDIIPEARIWPIKADSARPDYISYLAGEGFAIEGTEKYKGSVEDGIAWLQSVQIVVHPRCQKTWEELQTHKFIRHKQTDEVTRKPEDMNNHYIDALRYSWQSKWRRQRMHIA